MNSNWVHYFSQTILFHMFLLIFGIIVSFIIMKGLTRGSDNPGKIISYQKYKVLRLLPFNAHQVAALRYLQMTSSDLDFWTDASAVNSTIDVMVPPRNLESFQTFLNRQYIPHEIFLSDVQNLIDQESKSQAEISADELKDYRTISWKRYPRLREIYRFLNWLSISHPLYVHLVTIGRSFEGRPLRVVKIGKPVWGHVKPAVWIDAGMHAREWISPVTAVFIIDQLVNNYTAHRNLVDKIDWYILPVLNPDGYEFSHQKLRLWRKTRSTRVGNSSYNCIGTDGNRNFGFFWNRVGTSSNPCSEVYAGERAFSEPETRAVADFVLRTPNIKLFLSLHSYKQLLLMPWGHTRSRPRDYEEMNHLGVQVVEALKSIYGTQYFVGSSIRLLYTTSGVSTDWAKGVAGIKYTYTLELRDTGRFGFLLPATEILPTGRETMEAIKVFGQKAIVL
uniref:Zinc carboxypeptidase A 1 n=1 Tax=Strigamia maritima TaxID=126957 RepID=T1J8Z7_STRMM